ncbi:MAG: serine kinase [Pseudomonadota bacterium]
MALLPDASSPLILHASAVAIDGQAVVIAGASGQGKSSLALELLTLGALLVADDACALTEAEGSVWVSKPDKLPPLLEIRGMGLMASPMLSRARLALIVDLDIDETQRLPEPETRDILGHRIPVQKRLKYHFSAAIAHYLRYGRSQ